jgi:putative acetyltransferase
VTADLTGTGLMGTGPAEWDIRPLPWDDSIGVTLRTRMLAEVAMRYGTDDNEPGPPPTAETAIVFLVAFETDGTAIACGALRAIDDEHGEVKRFFVAPDKRGSGVARALLSGLEADARARGWARLVLETGDRQPEAMRFYEREGYHAIPAFGYYAQSPESRCYEKALR